MFATKNLKKYSNLLIPSMEHCNAVEGMPLNKIDLSVVVPCSVYYCLYSFAVSPLYLIKIVYDTSVTFTLCCKGLVILYINTFNRKINIRKFYLKIYHVPQNLCFTHRISSFKMCLKYYSFKNVQSGVCKAYNVTMLC